MLAGGVWEENPSGLMTVTEKAALLLKHKLRGKRFSRDQYKAAVDAGYLRAYGETELEDKLQSFDEGRAAVIYRRGDAEPGTRDVLLGELMGTLVCIKQHDNQESFLNELAFAEAAPIDLAPEFLGWVEEGNLLATFHKFSAGSNVLIANVGLCAAPLLGSASIIARRLEGCIRNIYVMVDKLGVAHIDTKHQNFVVDVDSAGRERVMSIDFGSIHRVPITDDVALCVETRALGVTPLMACPELLTAGNIGNRTDVFSLGVMIAMDYIFGPGVLNSRVYVNPLELQAAVTDYIASGCRIATEYMRRMNIPHAVGALAAITFIVCTGPYQMRPNLGWLLDISTRLRLLCELSEQPLKGETLAVGNVAFVELVMTTAQRMTEVTSFAVEDVYEGGRLVDIRKRPTQGPGLLLEESMRCMLKTLHSDMWQLRGLYLRCCTAWGEESAPYNFGNQTVYVKLLSPSEAEPMFAPLSPELQYTAEQREERMEAVLSQLPTRGYQAALTSHSQLLDADPDTRFELISYVLSGLCGWDEDQLEVVSKLVKKWEAQAEPDEEEGADVPVLGGSPLEEEFQQLGISASSHHSSHSSHSSPGQEQAVLEQQAQQQQEQQQQQAGPPSLGSQHSQQQKEEGRHCRPRRRVVLARGTQEQGVPQQEQVPIAACSSNGQSDGMPDHSHGLPSCASAAVGRAGAVGGAAAVAVIAAGAAAAGAGEMPGEGSADGLMESPFQFRHPKKGAKKIYLGAVALPFTGMLPTATRHSSAKYKFHQLFFLCGPGFNESHANETIYLVEATNNGIELIQEAQAGSGRWLGSADSTVFLQLPLLEAVSCQGLLPPHLQAAWESMGILGAPGWDPRSHPFTVKVLRNGEVDWAKASKQWHLSRSFDHTRIHSFLKEHVCVVLPGGKEMVQEPGLTIWHSTVTYLFSSKEVAAGIPLYASKEADSPVDSWLPLNSAAQALHPVKR